MKANNITAAIQVMIVFGVCMALGVVVGFMSSHLALLTWAVFAAVQVIFACSSHPNH